MNYNDYKTLNKNRIYGTSLYSIRGRNKRGEREERVLSIGVRLEKKNNNNTLFCNPSVIFGPGKDHQQMLKTTG